MVYFDFAFDGTFISAPTCNYMFWLKFGYLVNFSKLHVKTGFSSSCSVYVVLVIFLLRKEIMKKDERKKKTEKKSCSIICETPGAS